MPLCCLVKLINELRIFVCMIITLYKGCAWHVLSLSK